MAITFFKIFFSKAKEQAWLNSLGERGYYLTKINDSKYYFTLSEDESKREKYTYSIEYLDFSPESEMAEEYYKSREAENIAPVLTNGNWVYFCGTNSNIEGSAEMYKKNASFYFWRSFYLFFFTAFGAILSGYQIFAAKYLPAISHAGDGKFEMLSLEDKATGFAAFLNVLKKWWNGILDILNDVYMEFLTKIFGENDTVFVQAWLIPALIVLIVLFAFNFEQYLFFTNKYKKFRAKDEKNEATSFENESEEQNSLKGAENA